MDNTFILSLQNSAPICLNWRKRFLMTLIKLFNRKNPFFELSFKNHSYNQQFRKKLGLTKQNMLKGNMLSVEQAMNIYHLLVQVLLLNVPGEVVEVGCYEGTTALVMQKTLDQYQSNKILHVYDSFQGLPSTAAIDGTRFQQGSLHASLKKLEDNFNQHHARLPQIHAGWFKDTLPRELPEKIAFAHLDGDLYSSIKESLTFVYPRLSPNAIVVIDDYCDPTVHDINNILPGVKKACDEFFKDKPEQIEVLIAGCEAHSFFRKC